MTNEAASTLTEEERALAKKAVDKLAVGEEDPTAEEEAALRKANPQGLA